MNTSTIGIEGIRIFAYHGYYEEERSIGREFVIDIHIQMESDKAANTDELSDTVNYEEVLDICKEEMAITSKLLEHVCIRIAKKIKVLILHRGTACVRISKQSPHLPVQLDRFYVEMKL